ncbi:hypothetical protein FOPG_17627, partial [Fusarium oxysporum f. sp. conglutinans race 2 54008]
WNPDSLILGGLVGLTGLPDRLLCKQLVWSGLDPQTRPDQTIPITA